jgi:hypothetical protein
VRHLGRDREVIVDPDGAVAESFGGAERTLDVLRPDRCGQAVGHAVRPAKPFFLVSETLDGNDRAENLVLDDLGILRDARDDRRTVEEAPIAE